MILIEFILNIIFNIYYYVARFIVWFITARDCRHCKHSGIFHCKYYCCKTHIPEKRECLRSIHRKHFERV